jgi:hypothetical protein
MTTLTALEAAIISGEICVLLAKACGQIEVVGASRMLKPGDRVREIELLVVPTSELALKDVIQSTFSQVLCESGGETLALYDGSVQVSIQRVTQTAWETTLRNYLKGSSL